MKIKNIDTILFDLDGTLINSQHRLYNLFIELCPECKMSYNEYWEIKRQRINQKAVLKKYFNYSDEECNEFHKKWLKKIEEPERLNQDFLIDKIEQILNKLSQKYNLYIITNRQSKELTLKQLEALGIKIFFKDIFVTEQKISKEDLVRKNIDVSQTAILIGDTGEDIKCAHALGIKSIAVTWGFLNENILKEYCPDIIIKEVSEVGNYFI